MSCLELPKNAFRLKLSPTLLSQLLVADVKPDEFVEFVAAQFQNMIACKPNCRLFTTVDKPVWILRGYYPNTSVFFKITVVKAKGFQHHSGHTWTENFTYYVRARELQVKSKRKWQDTLLVNYNDIVLFSNDIMKSITAAMENSLLGGTNELKPLIKGGPTKPKCMSPKGMKLFQHKKPTKRKHEA